MVENRIISLAPIGAAHPCCPAMPELPEVEITRRSFADQIMGAQVGALRLGLPLRWPLGCAAADLVGRRVLGLTRRGKYLLLQLDRGCLLLHLGMSGSLRFGSELGPPGRHDHFDLQTDRGCLRLHDPRRFGAVVYVPSLDDARAQRLLAGLGVEPLDAGFEPERFYQALRGRRAAIKQVLLAGDVVVGVGNIYACEALFLAGIRPTLRAQRLSRARVARLHAAVVAVLQRALSLGGSTLRDFSSAQGEPGYFQLEAMVYGRTGLPCRTCTRTIKSIRQGQRSSFFCPQCQTF